MAFQPFKQEVAEFHLTFIGEHGKIILQAYRKRGERTMNLSEKSVENVEYMIEKIKEKLKVLNLGAIKPSHFDENMYEELKEIYDLVMKRDSFSPSETQALAEELGNLRKQ